MGRYSYMTRNRRSRRRQGRNNLPLIIGGVVLAAALGCGGFFAAKKLAGKGSADANTTIVAESGETSSSAAETEPVLTGVEAVLADAAKLAMGYDYDGAIEFLQSDSTYASDQQVTDAIAEYENIKSTLVRQDIEKITHVFFHTLIMDTSKAFDGDTRQDGYNQVMTTKDEFLKIMQKMYDEGFVLVRLHDMAYETTDENGQPKFQAGDIMLPEGKQAFVLSQDDVCYYEYMTGDGFATRMIIGEDGRPTNEMLMDDGTTSVGSYDVVPLLDDFIDEHPDFSYKGARGIVAFTGYNGILGYRTAPSYSENPTYEQDRETAAKVVQCLRDEGWEIASHSWGHRDMGSISYSDFKTDTDKWETEVESLTGPVDIILFPFGSDIGDWRPYTDDNERFAYLKSVGFRYFCNVDSHQYWVQMGNDHLRQGRRNLDGYRMWRDITEPDNPRLSDLFDANDVFDSARPTPVPSMNPTSASTETTTETSAETTAAQ